MIRQKNKPQTPQKTKLGGVQREEIQQTETLSSTIGIQTVTKIYLVARNLSQTMQSAH